MAGGGDILEEGSRAAQEYEEFWQTYLPLLSPSGVELFSRETASSPYGGSPAHWTYHHSDSFWSSPELDLPDGVYEQTGSGWRGSLRRAAIPGRRRASPPPGRSVPSPPPMAATCCPPLPPPRKLTIC